MRVSPGQVVHGVAGWARSRAPERATLKDDAIAGVPSAIGSVPDGMAASVLAGVNPVHGLYASFVGPIVGGLFANTRLMVITTTSASALAAGSAISNLPSGDRTQGLFALTILAGALMILAGLARLGRYVRFVALSVMLGFLSGVAVNIVLGQLPDLTGSDASGQPALRKAWDLVTHPDSMNLASIGVGVSALVILVVLSRTRLRSVATLFALVLPTLAALASDSVVRVDDGGDIPTGLPVPGLPDLGLFIRPEVLTGAFAVAVIVLVQGVGVAESAPNPDGSPSSANADFIAQGAANAAAGVFAGQPVGGSVGQTALGLAAGARSRWASILSGVWMALILLALSGVVGAVAMPTLAAILIFAAVSSFRLDDVRFVLRSGMTPRIALIATFVATLLLPVAAAVGLGVALSLLLQLNQEAVDLRVVEWLRRPDGRFAEAPAPETLPPEPGVTVLDVYGSLFYAGARTLAVRLPDPAGSNGRVVVLRLRGRTRLGATAFTVLADYAERLQAAGGRLLLTGVEPELLQQFGRARRVPMHGPVQIYEATAIVGESTETAYEDALAWVVGHAGDDAGEAGEEGATRG